MEAKELMIGNYVYEEYGGIYEVININSEGFDYLDLKKPTFKALGRFDLSSIKGLPLTEQWLLKFGFKQEKNKYWFSNEVISISVHKDGYYNIWGNSGREIARKGIKYVHQLQNLYFALTNKELAIVY